MKSDYETGETPVTNRLGLSTHLHPIAEVNIPGTGSWASICSVRIYDRLSENLDKWVDPDTKQVYDVGSYISGRTPEGIRVYGPKGKYLGYCPDFMERLRLKEEGYVIGQMIMDGSEKARGSYERRN